MAVAYGQEKRIFYAKIMPVVTLTMLLLSLMMEYFQRNLGTKVITELTTTVNWLAVLIFLALTLSLRRCAPAAWFVCPTLTALTFYYFAVVDYDGTQTSIYYTMIVGITVSFFILSVFNEVWLISAAVYTPLLAYYMWKTGRDMVGNENNELVVRVFFCAFLYCIVAYRMESLNKHAFIGQQNSDRTFFRWLKIFETFPEGLALVRNGSILYAN